MKIVVAGLFHLGCVTAACLAKGGHDVIGYDADATIINKLQAGQAPIFEPGLDDLIQAGNLANKLRFSADLNDVSDADIVWITYDTPVDDNDIADVSYVTDKIIAMYSHIKKHALVIISSQLPVGTARQLQNACQDLFPEKQISFACIPENLRLGKAIQIFTQPDRFVAGIQNETDKEKIIRVLEPFTQNIVWMSMESAEMTKHALNAFLATSVVFINELAVLCEKVGANASEVERGLKSEERIGPKAYLRPGNAIAGGTLARDVNYLIEIGKNTSSKTPLFSALLDSNSYHKQWACRKLLEKLNSIKNKTIAVLGLTYKAGTDTLRRSLAVEMCQWLYDQGANVLAHDPVIKQLPAEFARYINLKTSIDHALQNADAVMISTEWPEFRLLTADQIIQHTKKPLIVDPSGFLMKQFGSDQRIHYFSVGSDA